ncbi:hypothetical protein HYPSUDRAFT_818491 [Hypholoma sublateritium FD-334 SS-4]|uniref:Uncharacterized protein n=1 Tax=Hypholoma sublateritium (strain FD-334 SS-4) TaxID=945553 RepID=A0A0D2L139_HYPSF|nr:hypothetical protein HYPSUDRAFT_818491 [Hypholoma sublateritium FD-334 SS-4]
MLRTSILRVRRFYAFSGRIVCHGAAVRVLVILGAIECWAGSRFELRSSRCVRAVWFEVGWSCVGGLGRLHFTGGSHCAAVISLRRRIEARPCVRDGASLRVKHITHGIARVVSPHSICTYFHEWTIRRTRRAANQEVF